MKTAGAVSTHIVASMFVYLFTNDLAYCLVWAAAGTMGILVHRYIWRAI